MGSVTTSDAGCWLLLVDMTDLVDRLIIVISGPGGVGKGTIVDRLLDRDPKLWLSQSWTTRARRPGEAAGAYHFTDPEQFRAHVAAGGFLEWVEFLDYLQGTPVPTPPDGHDVVFEIDVHGAHQISEHYADALLLFVVAPSVAAQEERLRGRGDPAEKIEARLAKAAEETAMASEIGMQFVVNDDLERAISEIEELIEATRRSRRSRDLGW